MKYLKIILITVLMLFFYSCQSNFNEIDDSTSESITNSSRVIITLTDAPKDELSVLQVELTELKIADVDGKEFLVFSETKGGAVVVNLLNLQGINTLLGSSSIPEGEYKELYLSYTNAIALDSDGNSLTVLEQHYGTAKVIFNPNLIVGEDNVYIEIDFDINNSIYNIVAGPQGHLLLMPTLVIKIGEPEEDPIITDIKGLVESVESMSMVIIFNDEFINIVLNDDTVVEIDEIIMSPSDPGFDLTSLFFPDNLVEIDGTLDVETNTITATKIERKFENHGLESQGIVISLGDKTFDLLVLEPRDSGFETGSVQTISYDIGTLFLYSDPTEMAIADQLTPGQKVRITGTETDPAIAQKVKLNETKLYGTVVELFPDTKAMTFIVEEIAGIDIDKISGFINPITVEFINDFPENLEEDDKTKLEGFFNRVTMGTFSVYEYEEDDEEEEEEEGENEDGETKSTWVGKMFSIISSSPLHISLTRGGNGGNIESRTVEVIVNGSTIIIKKDRSTTVNLSQSELISGINADSFSEMKAEGLLNKTDNTLKAAKIIMTAVKK